MKQIMKEMFKKGLHTWKEILVAIGLLISFPLWGPMFMLGWALLVKAERDRVHSRMLVAGHSDHYIRLQRWKERAEKHRHAKEIRGFAETSS